MCKPFDPSKCLVYIKLLWIGPVSQVFPESISKAVTCCFDLTKVRTIFTTFNITMKLTIYIGWTIMRLEVRVRQHVPLSLLNRSQELISGSSQAQESALGEHLCRSYIWQANYLDQHFSVLYKAYSKNHLAVWESITI